MRAVSSWVTTKLFDPVLAPRWGHGVVSPRKLALSEYVPACSPGVMEQDTIPLALVVPEQDSFPFNVSVTGSLAAPADV